MRGAELAVSRVRPGEIAASSGFGSPAPAHLARRSPLLDCIRAVAIFMVLVFHVATRYPPETLDAVAAWFWRYGNLGVDMFFPLSGYLISRFLLFSDAPDMIRTFFLRRVFRIMPLYYAAVATYVAASLATGIDRELLHAIWAPLTFTTGWYIFAAGSEAVPYQITWSLSVEEFAYILFGIAAWISRRHFLPFLVAALVVPTAIRIWLHAGGFDEIYFLPIARIDAIAVGGLLAWALGRGLPVIPVLLGLIAALWLGFGIPIVRETLYLSMIALLTCLAIALFETRLKSWRPAWLQPMALVGFYSYFIYLFHFFAIYGVFAVMEALGLPVPFWGMVGLSLGVTVAAAVLSWRLFEGPLIEFGRSLEKRAVRER
jgi:peptidoglycan/LPS O-acetylase OafA/YrhL